MKHLFPAFSRRNLRAFAASLISYFMLAGQLAPLATGRPAARRDARPADVSEARPDTDKGAVRFVASPAVLAAPAPAPLAAPALVPMVTATKSDSYPSAPGAAQPGETITYTVTITNNGMDPATGVVFTDTPDPNTTLVPGSIQTQPVAANDSFGVLGNVRIQVPDGAGDLLSNDCNPDPAGGACTNAGLTISMLAGDASAPFSGTSAQGGQVTAAADDGSFQYNPPPGFEGADTFSYTVTDGTHTDTATVTLNVSGMVWFVDANQAANGDGRLTSPFNCLRGPGCFDSTTTGGAADDPGDNIFLYASATNYDGGLTLLNNQKLIGQGASSGTTLDAIAGVTVPPNSDALPALNGNPGTVTIISSANGINIGTGSSSTLRGFTVGNTMGAKIASPASPPAAAFGTLTVSEVALNGTGQALNLDNGTLNATFTSVTTTSSAAQGISLDQIAGTLSLGNTTISGHTTQCILITGSTANITFASTSCTGGTDGVSLQNNSAGTRTFGSISVSGNSSIGFLHANGGGNVNVPGSVGINSAGNGIDIQNAAASTTVNLGAASVTKTTTGGAGVNLVNNNAAASIVFNPLSITTSNGPALNATGSGTINIANGSPGGTISATGSGAQPAPAILANGVTLNAAFTSVSSTNSGGGGGGISLTNVAGTSNFGTGAISNAAGTAFFVSGGNPTVTYAGNVTQNNAARLVDIQNTTGGTITFNTGTLTGGAASTGVQINNANGNVSFANLNLGTSGARMNNQAVTITNGGSSATYSLGAVSIFTNNVPGIVSTNADGTLNSMSGTVDAGNNTAVNIDGPAGLTTLGMTLTRVDSSGGSAAGIIIQDTNGSFVVNGDGSNTAVGGNGSGGTIANKSGANGATAGNGVFLSNASGVTLRRMTINGTNTNHAIRGINSSNFTLEFSTVSGTNGDDTGLDEGSVNFDNLTGTAAITSSLIEGGLEDNLNVVNTSGTLNRLVITNTTFGFNSTANGNNNILLEAQNAGTTLNFTLQSSTIQGARADWLNASANSGSTMDMVIGGSTLALGNTFDNLGANAHPGAAAGGNRLVTGSVGNQTIDIRNNTLRGARGEAIRVRGTATGALTGTINARVRNNTIGVQATANSGSAEGSGIFIFGDGGSDMDVAITDNSIFQYNNHGILLQFGDEINDGSVFNATVTGNTVNTPGTINTDFNAIHLNNGTVGATDNFTTCADIGGAGGLMNNVAGGGKGTIPPNNADIRLRQRQATTVRLPGYAGANNNDAAVILYLTGRNTLLTAAASNTVPTGGGFVGGAACTQPSIAPATIEVTGPVAVPGKMPNGAPAGQTAPDGATPDESSQPDSPPSLSATGVGASAPSLPSLEGRAVETVSFSRARRTDNNAPGLRPTAKRDSGVIFRHTASAASAPLGLSQLNAVQDKQSKGGGGKTGGLPRPDVRPRTKPVISGVNGSVMVNIGTLAAGDIVQITFQVTVNNPFGGGSQVSNQGMVSGTNFTTVLTDDPDTGAANDPTLTPIDAPPDIFVRDASAAEPASGSSEMLFTVTLSKPAVSVVTVNFTTADDTLSANPATAGTDYTTTSGTATFQVGQRVQTIVVPVLADGSAGEPDETFLLQLSNPSGGNISDGTATGTITEDATPGTTLISELRTSGPVGLDDDFVEIYNNTDSPVTVSTTDGSPGWGLFKRGADCDATPVLIGTIANGTVIPARGHFLFVGSAYSLANYGGTGAAAGNQTLTANIESDANVGLFSTTNLANLSALTRLDAVGFGTNTGNNCSLLREGNNLGPASGSALQHSYFRKQCDFIQGQGCQTPGMPKDTGDNAADLAFADTTGTEIAGTGQRLGAPGPENLASPLRRDPNVPLALLDSTVSGPMPPNRVRDLTAGDPNTSAFGTLSVRRRVVNNTGGAVTRLRFRIVELTTFPAPSGQADIRALTSTPVAAMNVNDSATCLASNGSATTPCTVTVEGTTLETPPAQPGGGGLNSTLTVTLGTPLANGASVNVQFLLGVQQTGLFRFLVVVEALP